MNYYNEFDPDAAAWLGELVASRNIPEGRVDDRSVVDVRPGDLSGYTQCHFFAGIGGWAYAIKLAGWGDDKPIWTASLPCQPFSVAGKGLGEADDRHLWPVFRELVRECRPAIIFGEQVASAAGRLWLAGVRADLEGMGYAVAAVDCCAAGIGAPHIRQRLYWVAVRMADADQWQCGRRADCQGRFIDWQEAGRVEGDGEPEPSGEADRMGDADRNGREPWWATAATAGYRGSVDAAGSGSDGLSDSFNPGLEGHSRDEHHRHEPGRDGTNATGPAPECGKFDAWSDFYLVECRDGKVRRVGTCIFTLAHGLPRGLVPSGDPSPQEANASQEGRKTRLRGYGNAIVPQLAAEFIRTVMDFLSEKNTH